MASYFQQINEDNKFELCKPSDSNIIYYTELSGFQTTNAFRNFSIKYVLDQSIHYKIGTRIFNVQQGTFLLGNKQPGVKAYSESKLSVKSLCIDIAPNTIAEAYNILNQKEKIDLENNMVEYFIHPNFFEDTYHTSESSLGYKLEELANDLKQHNTLNVNNEWFLNLAEYVVRHECGNHVSLTGLTSLKTSTRKELLYRLKQGKKFMQDNFLNNPDIKMVARFSLLSEFHFYRSFKLAFGITPYQYLLKLRLEHAKKLIIIGEYSIKEIASVCSFPDAFTFSKSFKKLYGISPSAFYKKYAVNIYLD